MRYNEEGDRFLDVRFEKSECDYLYIAYVTIPEFREEFKERGITVATDWNAGASCSWDSSRGVLVSEVDRQVTLPRADYGVLSRANSTLTLRIPRARADTIKHFIGRLGEELLLGGCAEVQLLHLLVVEDVGES